MDEFPHEVFFQVEGEKQSDGGGGSLPGTGGWETYDETEGFLDTPKSTERFIAQQANHPIDRRLYYAYRADIKTTMRVYCEGDTYEIVGKPLDQGGQHEIMRIDLRLIDG
ncbi:phage head closure protein [Oceanobacillus kimchii]|uniref:phage head closure protein n=1 Tax=Oceanobacillus kimchii TaxID=746691 RepID=UPI003B0192FB